MARQKTILMIAAAVVILWFTPSTWADTHVSGGVVIGSHGSGIGIWIGKPPAPPAPPVYRVPAHREVVVAPRPWGHRFVRIEPPCPAPVVVARPPVARPVVVSPPVIVQEGPITVWITNSNGSKTTVQLTRRGPWYVGPRGEYYDQMPTNEQLRVVYGL